MSGITQYFVGLTLKCFVALLFTFLSINNTVVAGNCDWMAPAAYQSNETLAVTINNELYSRPDSACALNDRSLRVGESFTRIATSGDFSYGKSTSGHWGWTHKTSFEKPDDCSWVSPSDFHTNYALSAKVKTNMLSRPTTTCAVSDRLLSVGESFTHVATDGEFFYGQNASGLWGWVHSNTFKEGPSGCFTNDGHIVARPGTCVGVPATVNLVDYSSGMNASSIITISDSNITIEGKRFIGCVRLTGDNVTFRNNYVECYRSRDNLNNASAYTGSGPVMATGNGTTIEYNTLVCKMRNDDDTACDYGVFSGKSLVRFNDISGPVDGIDVRAGARVQFNYIHDFGVAYEQWRENAHPNELTHYSHADGVQLYAAGSGEILIEGNFFMGLPTESNDPKFKGLQGMLLAAGGQQKPTVRIINNKIGGYWPSLRIACMGGTTCDIKGNIINERYNTNSSAAINLNSSHSSTTVRCNYFTDGQLVEDNDIWQGQANNSGC